MRGKTKVDLSYDTGAVISIIKIKNFKGNALLHEEKIKLTGFTGHTMMTIGKVYAIIILRDKELTHPLYVMKDDSPFEYNGILGADFISTHIESRDYRNKQIKRGNTYFKLHPYRKITLPQRCETIVQVTDEQNMIGVTQPEEPLLGIFIGSCLVKPHDYQCPISILNTTENKVRINAPHIELEELGKPVEVPINTVAKKNSIEIDRQAKIRNLLRVAHLNQEEEKALILLCEEYSDIFHLDGEPSCTSGNARDKNAHKYLEYERASVQTPQET